MFSAVWVLQTLYVVETGVIELLQDRIERVLNVEEIGDKAGMGVNRALQPEHHAMGMAVKVTAFVGSWNIWEPVGRLEGESLCDFHLIPRILWV